MTETRPLHVRVAEALGWVRCEQGESLLGDVVEWYGIPRGDDGYYHGTHIEIPRYDTDWSATGPLIEKYGISLNYFLCDPGCCEPDGVRWTACSGNLGMDFPDEKREERTPLIAVCHLILALKDSGKL